MKFVLWNYDLGYFLSKSWCEMFVLKLSVIQNAILLKNQTFVILHIREGFLSFCVEKKKEKKITLSVEHKSHNILIKCLDS